MRHLLVSASLLLALPLYAQTSCRDARVVRALDAAWERALLESDIDTLDGLMAAEFRWVHNHASMTDSREQVLARANSAEGPTTTSRESSEVVATILGSTAVVSGYTAVTRGGSLFRFHFMRTYAEAGGRCLLLGNHTMAIPDEGGARSGAL